MISLGRKPDPALHSRRGMHRIAFLAFLALLPACPDSGSSDQSGGPDAGTTQQVDAAVPEPTKRALVEVRIFPPLYAASSPELKIRGGFIMTPDPKCQRTQIGMCEVADCPQALIGAKYADPGKLSFEPSSGLVTLSPGASWLWLNTDFIPWAANDRITLTAAGKGTFPAFTASVASPRTLDAGEGRPINGAPIVTSQPFYATWVPLAEDVLVEMRQGRDTPAGPYDHIVTCTATGSSGQTTVPAAALAQFKTKANGGLSVEVSAHAMRSTRVVAGDFAVTYRVLRSFDEHFYHDVQ